MDYSRAKEYDKAIDAFKEYIVRDPENSAVCYKLYNLFKEKKKLREGELYFNGMVKKNPENAVLRWSLGLFYFKTGRNNQAIELFKNSIF